MNADINTVLLSLDIEFSHDGDMIELSDRRPCDAEIRDSEDGLRHLTGFMPTRNAERFDGLETEIGICNYLLNVSESK